MFFLKILNFCSLEMIYMPTKLVIAYKIVIKSSHDKSNLQKLENLII